MVNDQRQVQVVLVVFDSFYPISTYNSRGKVYFPIQYFHQKVQMARNFAKFLTDKVAVITASTDGYVFDILRDIKYTMFILLEYRIESLSLFSM